MVIARKTWGWHNDFFDRGKSREVRSLGKGQKPFVILLYDVIIYAYQLINGGASSRLRPCVDVDDGADNGKRAKEKASSLSSPLPDTIPL